MNTKELANKSTQEVFDTVVRHLLTQGQPAYRDEGYGDECVYRTESGLKCAVGCLIGDEEYSPYIEGKSVVALEGFYPEIKNHQGLLIDLQDTHDNYDVDDWAEGLQMIAQNFGLDCGVLDEQTH